MQGYWIKIILKAVGIFVVGMIIVTGIRKAKGSINHAINSSDPIPIPLIGLVPFNLDNSKMGSVSRVEFLRSDPEHVSGIRVVVKLADTINVERIAPCQLALDDVDHINDRTTFRCAQGDAIAGLEPFGEVALKNSSETFPLLLPAGAIAKLRATSFSFHNGKVNIESPPGPADVMSARVDSMHGAIEALIDAQSDSIDNLRELSSDLEDSASDAPRDKRRELQTKADAARTEARELLDRMKANEGRMHALEKISQMREMQGDWKEHEGATISDSVSQFVNEQLSRVQLELERQGISNLRVNVQLDSLSAAALRQGMAKGRAAQGRGQAANTRGTAAITVQPPAAPKATAAPKAAPTPPAAPTPAVEKP